MRRGQYLVHDTLLQVQSAAARRALKRPLRVAFLGEEGVDEGGVQKARAVSSCAAARAARVAPAPGFALLRRCQKGSGGSPPYAQSVC